MNEEKKIIGKRLPESVARRGYSLGERNQVKKMLRSRGLETVCESARCPNIERCFSRPTATYLILGATCLRGCSFCAVKPGSLEPPDPAEPEKVAEAAAELGLRHVVITSVTRDDLPDGGAAHFAETIRRLRSQLPTARIEVLTPDFNGNLDALKKVLAAGPDVFNHNIETVAELYPLVRPAADYRRSIELLAEAKKIAPEVRTKSGLMVGFGETFDQLKQALVDLRSAGVELLTIGQYLRPTRNHPEPVEYLDDQFFAKLSMLAAELGFAAAACAPLVRSSFEAEEIFNKSLTDRKPAAPPAPADTL